MRWKILRTESSVARVLQRLSTENEKRSFLANQLHFRRDVLQQNTFDRKLMTLVENRERKELSSLAANLCTLIQESNREDENSKKRKIHLGEQAVLPHQLVQRYIRHKFQDKRGSEEEWFDGNITGRIKGFSEFCEITRVGDDKAAWVFDLLDDLRENCLKLI